MKRPDEYITEQEVNEYCSICSNFCTSQCVIMKKAILRYNEEVRRENESKRSTT